MTLQIPDPRTRGVLHLEKSRATLTAFPETPLFGQVAREAVADLGLPLAWWSG
jgi:hypothetical protein